MKPIIVITGTRSLQHKGATIKHYPFINIVPITVEPQTLKSHYDWLIFTSVNAIKVFKPYLLNININHIAVIGEKTKQYAIKEGLRVDLEATNYTQEGILKEMKERVSYQSILIPCSEQARPKLARELKSMNNDVQRLNIYRSETNTLNVEIVHELIKKNKITDIAFSSPSAVSSYFEKYKKIDNINVYAIGEITKRKLNEYKQKCIIANKPTLNALVNTIIERG